MDKMTQGQIESALDETFDRLCEIWKPGLKENSFLYQDYWKAGNTLDAYITYLALFDETKAKKIESANQFVKDSYEIIYEPRKDYPQGGAWRDDYGWWGNAFANAYKNRDKIGLEDPGKYLAAAEHCWSILHQSAQANLEWGNASGNQKFKILGGMYCAWNNDGVQKFVTEKGQIGPVPNTVTIVGHWALSIHLYNIHKDDIGKRQPYYNAIRSIIDWFFTCYEVDPITQPNLLLNSFDLIRETPNPAPHQKWCFDLDRAWSADQGMFLYCLDQSRTITTEPPVAFKINVLWDHLFAGFRTNGGTSGNRLFILDVLHEFATRDVPATKDSNLSNYNDNYCTGPGVFMRYASKIGNSEAKKLFKRVAIKSSEGAIEYRDIDPYKDANVKNQILCWYQPIRESPYEKYFPKTDSQIWYFALQTAGLDVLASALQAISSEKPEVAALAT